MKILINWVGPWVDKGEAAMIISTAKALREKIPNVSITILTAYPPQEIDILKYSKYDLKVLPGLIQGIYSVGPKLKFLKSKVLKAVVYVTILLTPMIEYTLWLLLYKGLRLNTGFLIRNATDTVKEYSDADWIIFCGGQYITNVGPGLLIALYEIIFSKLLGKPVMLYAQSFGPFNPKYARPLIKRILNKVDIITTREGISKRYLNDIGVTAPIFETADAAFLLPPIPREDALTLIEHEARIPKNELMVGLTAIPWYFPNEKSEANKIKKFENYLEALAGAVDYIIEKLNVHVIFFPHVTLPPSNDDRPISKEVFNRIENKSKVTVLTDDYSPEQLKGMYGCMSLFIGTRYHSCIFALSMNVPTIPIGYSHKAPGITKMLGLEDYLVDINTITTHDLISKIDKIGIERDEVKKKLEEKIRVMQAKSMDNVRLAVTYLGLRKSS